MFFDKGGVDYFTHRSGPGHHDLWLGDEEHAEEGYLTDLLSRRAVNARTRGRRRHGFILLKAQGPM